MPLQSQQENELGLSALTQMLREAGLNPVRDLTVPSSRITSADEVVRDISLKPDYEKLCIFGAARRLTASLELFTRTADHSVRTSSLAALSGTLRTMGFTEEARRLLSEGQASAAKIPNIPNKAYALSRVSAELCSMAEERLSEQSVNDAQVLFGQAIEGLKALDPPWRADVLGRLIGVIARIEDRNGNSKGAEQYAEIIANPIAQADVFLSLGMGADADLAAIIGFSEKACVLTSKLHPKGLWQSGSDAVLLGTADSIARLGDLPGALKIGSRIASATTKAQLLLKLARHELKRGHAQVFDLIGQARSLIKLSLEAGSDALDRESLGLGSKGSAFQILLSAIADGDWAKVGQEAVALRRRHARIGRPAKEESRSVIDLAEALRFDRGFWEACESNLKAVIREFPQLPVSKQVEVCAAVGVLGTADHILLLKKVFAPENRDSLHAVMLREAAWASSSRSKDDCRILFGQMQEQLCSVLNSAAEGRCLVVRELVDALNQIGLKQAHELLLQQGRSLLRIPEGHFYEQSPNGMDLLQGLGRINTLRANDVLLSALKRNDLRPRHAFHLTAVLVRNKTLLHEVAEFLRERRDSRVQAGYGSEDRCRLAKQDIGAVQELLRHSIMPSRGVFDHVVARKWQNARGRELTTIKERLKEVAKYQKRFSQAKNGEKLLELLAKDGNAALSYYLLHNGSTRFDLINNYSAKQFSELIGIAARLKIGDEPLERFAAALENVGFSQDERDAIITNLRNGHHPFYTEQNPVLQQVISLSVTDVGQIEQANEEVGIVIGCTQVGACLKAALYRQYLDQAGTAGASQMKKLLGTAETLEERCRTLELIERKSPELLRRAIDELEGPWRTLGDKLMFNISSQDVLTQPLVQVRIEDILWQIEERRLSLAQARKDLLMALKGENSQLNRVNSELRRKERACKELEKGLERNPALQNRIDQLGSEIAKLKEDRARISERYVSERYSDLSDNVRYEKIRQETEELKTLTEKDKSALFAYMVMETVGEDRLTEQDANLLKEIASHLTQPFRTIEELSYQNSQQQGQERKVLLRFLDKKDDLATYAHFADARICCFSSNNYDMIVAHGRRNKEWVASILRDPLSFVFEILEVKHEDTLDTAPGGDRRKRQVQNNLGFVFGMFGGDADWKLLTFLNGVYESLGTGQRGAAAILNGVERMLSRPLRAVGQIVGINGSIPDQSTGGYALTTIEATRLRALADDYGNAEIEIYDDLGKTVNQETSFTAYWKQFL